MIVKYLKDWHVKTRLNFSAAKSSRQKLIIARYGTIRISFQYASYNIFPCILLTLFYSMLSMKGDYYAFLTKKPDSWSMGSSCTNRHLDHSASTDTFTASTPTPRHGVVGLKKHRGTHTYDVETKYYWFFFQVRGPCMLI